jgi:hypothetical protein
MSLRRLARVLILVSIGTNLGSLRVLIVPYSFKIFLVAYSYTISICILPS